MLMAGFLPFSAIYIELCEHQQPPAAAQGAAALSAAGRAVAGPPATLAWVEGGCACLPAGLACSTHHPPTPTPLPADYIFASVWGHKVYTIYSILFIVFIILIIVTAFITIALTYFQLAVEDHRCGVVRCGAVGQAG
jgi:hypothetical protein